MSKDEHLARKQRVSEPAEWTAAHLPEEPNAESRVAEFSISYTRFIDETGTPIAALPDSARNFEHLIACYRHMVRLRLFDRKAVALQRTGQLGTYPSSLGQEATAVGLGAAMAAEDVLLGTYRETGTMLVRGVRMTEILRYWGGDETGMDYRGPGAPRGDFPICVPIATHAPHAVGVVYAFKHRREPRVAVCVVGDGATSKGDFYEAMNAAGVWNLPLVFVIVNNGWAISVPRQAQSRAETLAQKAIAAGIDGEQVDGNDLIAVQHVAERAIAKARAGDGPHVIEALTYRIHDHTTADDARRYRTEEELAKHAALDPIKRLSAYLARASVWSDGEDELLQTELGGEVEAAAAEYLATPARSAVSMFDHLFARLPGALRRQRDTLAGDGDDE
jgi:2-oxoisovalerate dehydrogenase E1 component subunit alpha